MYSIFDPSAPRLAGPNLPAVPVVQVMPPHTILPPAEYARRKGSGTVIPRAPSAQSPPRVAYNNGTAGMMPEIIARMPLANEASVIFEGNPSSIYQPPDPDIAVGPDDILQVMNSAIGRYTRAGQRTDLVPFTTWFQADYSQLCPSGVFNCLLFDPTIKYDQMHGRFVLTLMAVDFPTFRSHLLISVSNGATYASGWKNWVFNARMDGTTLTSNWADYPQMGFDANAVYLSANMFSFSAAQFQYAKLRIIKKSDLYNPATTTLPFKDIVGMKHEDGTLVSTLMPATMRGRVGVGGGGVFVAASDMQSPDYLSLFRVDPLAANPTLARTTLRGIWKYDYPAPIPQLGTTITLGSGDSRILKAIVRENVLWAAHGTKYPDEPVTVTWDRIDLPSNKIALQARMINGNFFFPAFDVPATVGMANIFPNKLIAGTTTSPTGALTYAGITDVKAGEDYYDQTSGGSSARWGDYFGAAIDPIQGGMWVTGQYAKKREAGASRYGLQIAYFPWGTLQEFNDVPSSRTSFNFVNVMRIWGITSGCAEPGGPKYCPDIAINREQMATFVVRSLYGENFTYNPTPLFADVPTTSIYFKYIQKLKELGIFTTCAPPEQPAKFCPFTTMTREETAQWIIRAKLAPLHGENFPHPPNPYFTDVPVTSPYFKFVQRFREMGITQGCTATEFCPTAFLTREQMAVFISRAFLN